MEIKHKMEKIFANYKMEKIFPNQKRRFLSLNYRPSYSHIFILIVPFIYSNCEISANLFYFHSISDKFKREFNHEKIASLHKPFFLPLKWERISPRLSLSYDIFGTGKDVIKLSVSRYGAQSGMSIGSFTNPGGWAEIDLLWVDANGDELVTENELWGYDFDTYTLQDRNDPDYWLYFGGFDPSDPGAAEAADKYGPDYNSPLLDEVMLSYQKEIMPDFAARVELFYKKRHNLRWTRGYYRVGGEVVPETPADFEVAGHETRAGEDMDNDYYGRIKSKVSDYRSGSKRYTTYKAVQLVLTKRLSNKWMLDGSFTYQDWRFYYGGSIDNPSNVDFFDGGIEAPESGGSGMTDIFINSRWMAKLMGLYQLPYGINISGTFMAREGYVIPRKVVVDAPRISPNYDLYAGEMGDRRLPTFWMLSLRLEKVFQIGDTRVVLSGDAFNITNNATSLKKEAEIDLDDYMETKRIVNPGVFRVGIRFEF